MATIGAATAGLVQTRSEQRTARLFRQYVFVVLSYLCTFAALYATWSHQKYDFHGTIVPITGRNAPTAVLQGSVNALYFATTVFSTTGFGDVSPHSTAMKAAVTLQMLIGMAIVVVGFGVLVSSLAAGDTRRSED